MDGKLRQEAKKSVQSVAKMEACTLTEAREILRAVLNGMMGGAPWDASVHIEGEEKFQLHWYEGSEVKK